MHYCPLLDGSVEWWICGRYRGNLTEVLPHAEQLVGHHHPHVSVPADKHEATSSNLRTCHRVTASLCTHNIYEPLESNGVSGAFRCKRKTQLQQLYCVPDV